MYTGFITGTTQKMFLVILEMENADKSFSEQYEGQNDPF